MKSSMLFPDPSGDLCDFLDRLPGLLERARPQKSRHRDRLPQGVEELSNLLTIDRDHLPPDYMARPPLLAAYLHYFLPWNLVRQVRLLGGLAAHLDLKPDASIVDVGAGPLTFALAMWLALPQLRTRRLDITAEDRTDAPMRVGRVLLRSLDSAGSWRVALSRPAGMGGRQGSSGTPRRKADLLVAANVMNEIPRGAHRTAGNPGASLQALLRSWERRLTPHGRILVIEPGVRDACRMLTDLRGLALERGWRVVSPCPHQLECPQPGIGRRPWCHFAFATGKVPHWLEELGLQAGLPKERASLGFLLLERADAVTADQPAGGLLPMRVVSDPFDLPEARRGVYGCTARGMVLLELGAGSTPPQGDLLEVREPSGKRKDKKSGALIIGAPEANSPPSRGPRKR